MPYTQITPLQMLSLNQQKNMFNISHDDYYNPRHTTGDNVMAGTGQIVQVWY